MGGICSKSVAPSRGSGVHAVGGDYNNGGGGSNKKKIDDLTTSSSSSSSSVVRKKDDYVLKKKKKDTLEVNVLVGARGDDELYDGIPRYVVDSSFKSRSIKVSEVGSRLSRVGTRGLGKAVNVLDTLGSGMANLNTPSGFASGAVAKGHQLQILAFEVANTIVKGSDLVKSLSKLNTLHMKEDVLPSQGVQNLVSENMDELLRIVAADKREELRIFSREVVRFGNSCKDAQWHNLDRYFKKIAKKHASQEQLQEQVEYVVEELMVMVHYTAELYQELHSLERFESNFQRQLHGEDKPGIGVKKGEDFLIFKAELKGQRKQVKILKKKSLWSRSMDEVMEKLVDIVQYIDLEIQSSYGTTDDESVKQYLSVQRLGPAGLALHYANIVIQIDNLVARSSSMPPNTRDALYQSLPPNIKSSLRSKLQPFSVKEELTVLQVKDEMEKTLHWLVPIATDTAKAHHGFGWVGEWANNGSDMNRKSSGSNQVSRIETLHHASKDKTEAYILELVLWLHQLVIRLKANAYGASFSSSVKLPIVSDKQNTNLQNNEEEEEEEEVTDSLSSVQTLEDIMTEPRS